MFDIDQSMKMAIIPQTHAVTLLMLLDQALSQVNDEDHHLADLHDRLADAVWLSRWCLKDVALELRPAEIIDVSEAVIAMLNEREWSDDECRALQSIVDRFSLPVYLSGTRDATDNSGCISRVASHLLTR
jgi:hypothetical protein